MSKGYDLDYVWKQVDRDPDKDAAGYYIQAAESGGEPPGRWWGPAVQALGLAPGQQVERKPYDLLFGERKAPDGTALCRPPSGARKAADLYGRLLAAEPHATAERKRELRLQAVRQSRQGPLFFDLTLSPSKSISIFHAPLGENARLAREAGDAYWSGLVGEVDAMIWQAVHAGFAYFQREAGYTRTGSHNTRVNGRETDPAAAAALLEDLAERAPRSEFEPVLCLEAPVPEPVPRGLLRADGRSVYSRHGGVRYATSAQLSMEERMLAQATAAAPEQRTGSGLRVDQAAAAMSVLSDGRRVSVIGAPAGSGKTRVIAEIANQWQAARLGEVIGITASQSARNTLAAHAETEMPAVTGTTQGARERHRRDRR